MRWGLAPRTTLFGASLYFVVGVNLPFYPVWLADARSLTGTEIGLLLGGATLLRIVSGSLLGAWVEVAGLKRVVLAITFVAALAYLVQSLTSNKPAIFVLGVIAYNCIGSAMPLADASLLSATKGVERLNYGVARAISSAAFIVANLLGGLAIQTYAAPAIIVWLTVTSLVVMFVALMLPSNAQAATSPSILSSLRAGIALYRQPGYRQMMIATVLLQATHAYYYNFGSIIWVRSGFEQSVIGGLWAIGVVAEVFVLAFAVQLFRHWSPHQLALLSAVGGMIRWGATGFSPDLSTLIVLQALHALTFATTLLATMRYLQENLPDEKLPVAVSLNAALAFGPAMAVLGFLSGVVYDWLVEAPRLAPAMGYWMMAAISFCAAGIVAFELHSGRQKVVLPKAD